MRHVRALLALLLCAGCGAVSYDEDDTRPEMLYGAWVDPPDRAEVDEPWSRITFGEDGRYAASTFNSFTSEWTVTADTLSYELSGDALRLQRTYGPFVSYALLALTDSTLVLGHGGQAAEPWRRPRAGDPGY